MKIMRKTDSPRYMRDGITSCLLISEITNDSRNLTTSLVEMGPGGNSIYTTTKMSSAISYSRARNNDRRQ